jgi:hypothetical protein
MNTLWFYWGQPHLSYLRYLTLLSASRVHRSIILVTRETPIQPEVDWREQQDFQIHPDGKNWLPDAMNLPIDTITIETLAPEIAVLQAPDVQTSDLLGWWILGNYGGTVADMDIVFFRPLPEIIQDVQVTRFSHHPQPGYMPVSFMQGRPCDAWKRALESAAIHYDRNVYESCGAGNFKDSVSPWLSDRVVYPWAGKDHSWSRWHSWLFVDDHWPKIPEATIGLHWYAGHNQRYNQAIKGPEDLKHGAVKWAAQVR